MLSRRFLVGAATALLLAACATSQKPAVLPPPPDPATQMAALETRIDQMVEDERLKLNPAAQPLALDSELVGIARERSAGMAQRNSFASPGDDTHVSATMLMDKDALFQGLLGENVAAQHYVKQSGVDPQVFAQRFVDMWLQSEPHRKNLAFSDYNRTGIGAAVNGDTVYVTQLFATDLGLGPYKDTTTPKKVTEYSDADKAAQDPPPARHKRPQSVASPAAGP
jgi:uncharacterized protein YkwD